MLQMFCVPPNIQQLVLDISKEQVTVHWKCLLVMSILTVFGMSTGNVVNIIIYKLIKLFSVVAFFT
jgi:hypothetical protein